MLTPYLPSCLRRTPYGVFHYRIVLPPHLAAATGKKEVWRSLRTRDPERAKLLAYLLNARFAMLEKTALADLLALSPDDIQQLTIHGLQVGKFKAERVDLDSTTPDTLQRDQAALKDLIMTFDTLAPEQELTPREAADAAELAALRAATKTKHLTECVRLYRDSKQGEISPASMKDYTNGLCSSAGLATKPRSASAIGILCGATSSSCSGCRRTTKSAARKISATRMPVRSLPLPRPETNGRRT